jgi:hypothetical protein
VLHGTASETEFTILETLKLILMEVLRASNDFQEVAKERAAAAVERVVASEERRTAAAERQAICASLDRMWSVLIKMSSVGPDVDSDQSTCPVPVQQTKKALEAYVLHAAAPIHQNRCEDMTCLQEQGTEDSSAKIAGEDPENLSKQSTASPALDNQCKLSIACSVRQSNQNDTLAGKPSGTILLPSCIENQEAAQNAHNVQPANTSIPMCAELAHTRQHPVNQLPCNSLLPDSEIITAHLEFREFRVHDLVSLPTASESSQASSVVSMLPSI